MYALYSAYESSSIFSLNIGERIVVAIKDWRSKVHAEGEIFTSRDKCLNATVISATVHGVCETMIPTIGHESSLISGS